MAKRKNTSDMGRWWNKQQKALRSWWNKQLNDYRGLTWFGKVIFWTCVFSLTFAVIAMTIGVISLMIPTAITIVPLIGSIFMMMGFAALGLFVYSPIILTVILSPVLIFNASLRKSWAETFQQDRQTTQDTITEKSKPSELNIDIKEKNTELEEIKCPKVNSQANITNSKNDKCSFDFEKPLRWADVINPETSSDSNDANDEQKLTIT